MFTFIGGCHSGDIIEAGDTLALAPTYVFKSSITQVATGTASSYGPEQLNVVSTELTHSKTAGEAWLAKQQTRNTPTHYRERYQTGAPGFTDQTHMFGEIFFGNPFATFAQSDIRPST